MAQLGNSSTGGFQNRFPGKLKTLAQAFTASSSFTAIRFSVFVSEDFGNPGTIYVALYSDSSGSPGSVLASGSASYAALSSGWVDVTISQAITSGTTYWLAAYGNCTGTFTVNNTRTASTGNTVYTWTETTAGSWTATPTIASEDANTLEAMYVTDTAAPVNISPSDASAVTESTTGLLISNVNVSDSSTISESITVTFPTPKPVTSDSSAVTDVLGNINQTWNIPLNDTSTATESVTIKVNTFLGLSDSSTVSESVVVDVPEKLSISESITVSESITMNIFVPLYATGVQENWGVRLWTP